MSTTIAGIAEQQHAFDRRIDERQRPEIHQGADVVTDDAGDDRGHVARGRAAWSRRRAPGERLARNAIQANSGTASTARTVTSSSKPTPRWYSALPNSPLLANKNRGAGDEQHSKALAPVCRLIP